MTEVQMSDAVESPQTLSRFLENARRQFQDNLTTVQLGNQEEDYPWERKDIFHLPQGTKWVVWSFDNGFVRMTLKPDFPSTLLVAESWQSDSSSECIQFLLNEIERAKIEVILKDQLLEDFELMVKAGLAHNE